MKKHFLLLLFVFSFVLTGFSQNVGIGTTTPGEKLDVNGNINLTGTLKANGTDGTPNQVLAKNSSGSLAWTDLGSFKSFSTFLVSGSWTVPANVTRIAVELWAGGGGATAIGGGGGGGYILGQFTVTPATVINFIVGAGGGGAANSTTSGLSGANSKVTVNTIVLEAIGGGGATYNSAGSYYSSGNGGTYSANPGFTAFIGMSGQNGTASKKNYAQAGTSTFYEIGEMGMGGDGANSENTGGKGTFYISTPGVFPPYNELRTGGSGKVPGGGGGCYLVNSFNGGNGMVIFRY